MVILETLKGLQAPRLVGAHEGEKACIIEAENIDFLPSIPSKYRALLLGAWSDEIAGVTKEAFLNGETCFAPNNRDAIRVEGARTIVAYFAHARLIRMNGNVSTRYGFVAKQEEHSERVSTKERLEAANTAYQTAQEYLNTFLLWLAGRLFECSAGSSAKHKRLKFRKIGK